MRKKKYPSDVSRDRFEQIRPLLEGVRRRTKPRTVDLYEVFCAVLYLLKSGCQWRMLPGEFPKWRTVHSYFAKWSEPGQDGRHVDLVWPLWNLFDYTSEGRGTDWNPKLAYPSAG